MVSPCFVRPPERSILDLDRGGKRLYFQLVNEEYKEQIYLGPQRRFGRTPFVSHLFQVSLLLEKNALLKNTHLLLFIYKRNRLRRINFLSTERQQRLKTRRLCTMLIIITKKGHYPFLEFSWSAALSVSSSLARRPLSLPNSILSSPPENYSVFFSVARQSRGRCAAVARQSRGRCAAVARQSRGRCAAVA